MEIYTIGFTKSSAERFFGRLRKAGIRRLIDIRLNNVSQLAGFAKRDDLAFLLRELCGAEYRHELRLAPEQPLLDHYRKTHDWPTYTEAFLALLQARKVEEQLERALFTVPSVLLCSEASAEHCHRRLAAEYLRDCWGGINIVHL